MCGGGGDLSIKRGREEEKNNCQVWGVQIEALLSLRRFFFGGEG